MRTRQTILVLNLLLIVGAGSALATSATECSGKFSGVELTQQQMDSLFAPSSMYSWLARQGSSNEHFCGARFRGHAIAANFSDSNLRGTDFRNADLSHSRFWDADMSGAHLDQARLVGAQFRRTNLRDASFSGGFALLDRKTGKLIRTGADLTNASFVQADLTGAHLDWVKFDNTVFELLPGALPRIESIAHADGLSKLTYENSAHSLIELREGFKRSGLREQEREVTCAINRTQTKNFKSPLRRVLHWVLFDLTSEYGFSPLRPLTILALGVLAFAPLYAVAMSKRGSPNWSQRAHSRCCREMRVRFARRFRSGCIWRIWQQDRILDKHRPDRERLSYDSLLPRFRYAIYFSLLSAFHVGWRDLNVGGWMVRIQSREYTMRATGWARTVSGLQSLISVYLVALSILTYFGRPFE